MQLFIVTQAAVGQFANLLRVYHVLKVAKQKRRLRVTSLAILLASPVIHLLLSSDIATVDTTIRPHTLHNPWRQRKWDILCADVWAVTLSYEVKVVSGVWTEMV
jgi:hypothetical protein